MNALRTSALVAALSAVGLLSPASAAEPEAVTFSRHIAPLVFQHCAA